MSSATTRSTNALYIASADLFSSEAKAESAGGEKLTPEREKPSNWQMPPSAPLLIAACFSFKQRASSSAKNDSSVSSTNVHSQLCSEWITDAAWMKEAA
jgi:hypothetical protein